jgi:hypothetical protein
VTTTLPFHQLATIGDPDGTRTVTSIIVLLVALGLGLAMLAIWLHRTTRPDPELLAPLEVMGERKWRRADPVAQRRTLDAIRPARARPLEPSVAPPALDAAFDAGPTATGFDDLHADAVDVDVDRDRADGRRASSDHAPAPPIGDVTPQQIDRPGDDDFSHEIDPDVLAAAAAELDAELHRRDEPADEPADG